MKQPTVLAAGAGYHLKAEAARLESLFYVMVALNGTRNYINDLTKDINLPTNHDNISAPLPYFYQYITISSMLKYRKHPLAFPNSSFTT
ncbi:hypothetical protein P4L08_11805 [Bacillus cereus]|nr:hypothetical protein [Bacillus cereus]